MSAHHNQPSFSHEEFYEAVTHDRIGYQMLSIEAQGLLWILLRQVNLAGEIPLSLLGDRGLPGLAVLLKKPDRWDDFILPALNELLEAGEVLERDGRLVFRCLLNQVDEREFLRREKERQKVRELEVERMWRNERPGKGKA